LNASQFVVLLPEIGLEDLSRAQEAEDGGITLADRGAGRLCLEN